MLLGDGECHEGTIWEAAHVANNLRLGNMCAVVDWNGSAAQLMPRDDLPNKWKSFGWTTNLVDGHHSDSLDRAVKNLKFSLNDNPNVLIVSSFVNEISPITDIRSTQVYRLKASQSLIKDVVADTINKLEIE